MASNREAFIGTGVIIAALAIYYGSIIIDSRVPKAPSRAATDMIVRPPWRTEAIAEELGRRKAERADLVKAMFEKLLASGITMDDVREYLSSDYEDSCSDQIEMERMSRRRG